MVDDLLDAVGEVHLFGKKQSLKLRSRCGPVKHHGEHPARLSTGAGLGGNEHHLLPIVLGKGNLSAIATRQVPMSSATIAGISRLDLAIGGKRSELAYGALAFGAFWLVQRLALQEFWPALIASGPKGQPAVGAAALGRSSDR